MDAIIEHPNKEPLTLITKKKSEEMQHERFVDSLLNVASGIGEYRFQSANRHNALEILKKKYPTMPEQWSKIEIDIQLGN